MKSIIMAGGKGTRMGGIEKALIEIGGITLLERVADALQDTEIAVAVTKNTPETWKKAEELGLNTIRTPGKGYHEDLLFLSKMFKEFLCASADLPFLNKKLVNDVIKKYDEVKRPVCVVIAKEDYDRIGFKGSYCKEGLVPVGLNIVAEGEDYLYGIKGKEAINVNTRNDMEEAGKWMQKQMKIE
ncbi:NTP transferase domain-containing protein [Candidatus Woesearchaeota archaeon]|nr:NTP transferase domain-containing protein [Candidatus Woesearchaeota archaeon]